MQNLEIEFIDGAADSPTQLRHQILSEVKAALPHSTTWRDVTRDEVSESGALTVTFFSDVPADILMMFDLSDRNFFLIDEPGGIPRISKYKKIFVAGEWIKRAILANSRLGRYDDDIVVVGSPRIDLLRRMKEAADTERQDASTNRPPRILYTPMPNNWHTADGEAMTTAGSFHESLELLKERFDVQVWYDGANRPVKEPVTNELLEADVVITDYASVMYEAWALGKPVIFPRWLTGDRVLTKAPRSAEAHVYRERIGHHAESVLDLHLMLEDWAELGLGDGVENFISEYIEKFEGDSSGAKVAGQLEELTHTRREFENTLTNHAIEKAARNSDWGSVAQHLETLVAQGSASEATYEKLADAYKTLGRTDQELATLCRAVEINPTNSRLFNRIANIHKNLTQFRSAARMWQKAIDINPEKAPASWYYNLGFALEAPSKDGLPEPLPAREAYEAAVQKDRRAAVKKYGIAALHTSAGRWKEAQRLFAEMAKKSPEDADLYYQLGRTHDRCLEWPEAEAAYVRALALDETNISWHKRLAFVLERQDKFEEAAAAYLHSASLGKSHQPTAHYRAGYTLEKAGNLQKACVAYADVVEGAPLHIENSDSDEVSEGHQYQTRLEDERMRIIREDLEHNDDKAQLWMTLSAALETIGDIEGALDAANKAMQRCPKPVKAYVSKRNALTAKLTKPDEIRSRLSYDCTAADDWNRLSIALSDLGDTKGAADALEKALLRRGEHSTGWWNRLGRLRHALGDIEGACDAFRNQMILQRPHGAFEDKFEENAALRETATFREFYDTLPMMKNAVLYESFSGEGCSDNPLAMFNQIQSDPRFEGWLHIWSIKGPDKIPPFLRNREDVIFVEKDSTLYQRYLATVPYLINNATFPFWYVRREGQHYLNTWHGTPLKTLGYDVEATPLQRANTARNLVQASLFIAPNKHTEDVMLGRYGIRNLFTGTSLLSGYPRIDMMINATEDEKQRIRKVLRIDPSKPVVLFAPTYRGHWATPELEAQDLAASLEKMKSDDYNLVFRGHYFAEKFIDEMNLDVNIAPHSIDTCSLLSIVDVLITDYSSIFYDFLITKRPVIHFVPDWDYYVETRGMYFGKDGLPGHICEDEESLLQEINRCITDPKGRITKTYLADLERYCSREDGKASERVVQAMFFDLPPDPVHPDHGRIAMRKPRAHFAYYAGSCDTGPELRKLRGLTGAAHDEGHINTVFVDRYLLINNETRTENSQALLDRTDVVMRFGRATLSLEEAWLETKLKVPAIEPYDRYLEHFQDAIRYESRRVAGHARFDAAVLMDPSRPFWARTFADLNADQSIAMLPGDFSEMAATAIPGLSTTTRELAGFDIITSDTDALSTANATAVGHPSLRSETLAPTVDLSGEWPDAGGRSTANRPLTVVCFAPDAETAFADPLVSDPALAERVTLEVFAPSDVRFDVLKASKAAHGANTIRVHADSCDALSTLRGADATVILGDPDRFMGSATEAALLGQTCFVLGRRGSLPGKSARYFTSGNSLRTELKKALVSARKPTLTAQKASTEAARDYNATVMSRLVTLAKSGKRSTR